MDEIKRQLTELQNKVALMEAQQIREPVDTNTQAIMRQNVFEKVGFGTADTHEETITTTPQAINIFNTPSGTIVVRIDGHIYELFYK